MKLKTYPYLLALVALALVGTPAVTASSPLAPSQDIATAPEIEPAPETEPAQTCSSADLTFGGLPDFLQSAPVAGCDNSNCNASCRAQGFDYGVCFISHCICRFYFP